MLELAERLAEHDILDHGHFAPFDRHGIETEIGLAARLRGVGEDVEAGGDHRAEAGVRQRIGRILEPARAKIGHQARAG